MPIAAVALQVIDALQRQLDVVTAAADARIQALSAENQHAQAARDQLATVQAQVLSHPHTPLHEDIRALPMNEPSLSPSTRGIHSTVKIPVFGRCSQPGQTQSTGSRRLHGCWPLGRKLLDS